MAKEKFHLSSDTSNLLIKAGIVIGGGVLVYKLVVKPVLSKLGLLSDANKAAGTTLSAWDVNFWKNAPAGSLILTTAASNAYAKDIYSYPGLIWDDYSIVIGTLKKLKTQSQVSFLADVFLKNYKLDLYQYLVDGDKGGFLFGGSLPADGLSDEHLTQINDYVKSLPKYK